MLNYCPMHMVLSIACSSRKHQCCLFCIGALGRCIMLLLHTTNLTVGHSGRAFSSVSSTSMLQATTVSSAWPQMYVTASGPKVSYNGTDVIEYAEQAASTSTHPAAQSNCGKTQQFPEHITALHVTRKTKRCTANIMQHNWASTAPNCVSMRATVCHR